MIIYHDCSSLSRNFERMNVMEQLTEQQRKFYSERIGKVYGAWKVTDITYNRENKKQLWILECIYCGGTKTVYHKNFLKTAMWCGCQREKKKRHVKEKIVYNNDESYIGKIYGNDKVIGFKKSNSDNSYQWICECQLCHKTHLREPSQLRKGTAPKCKCQIEKYDDTYIGRKFGRLTVIGYGNGHHFICQCECGSIKEYVNKNVIDGVVVSCGCYAKEKDENSISNSPLHATWNGMKQRCYNSNSHVYSNYGGRNITMCEEWRNDFLKFEEWAIQNGYRPNCGLSLDRIDVNGNYEPSNCRFTSIFVQNVNRRKSTGKYEIDVEKKTLKEWCKEYGLWEATVSYRMKKMGMSLKEALTAEKMREGNHSPKLLDITRERKKALEDLNKINSYIECNLYMAFCRLTSQYELIPQYKILNYKVDFLVKNSSLIVECDGYDQHKTKDQIASDYKRQRDIENEGYSVIRFSGSEINSDPDMCVDEILKRLSKINSCKSDKAV